MADLDWILPDGEDLEDALEDFKAEVENPELLKARHDAIRALADSQVSRGFKAEVFVPGDGWGGGSAVWPDRESAEAAARDLWSRWSLTTDHRALEVDEEPTRPTWEEHIAAHGPPPRSVRL